MHIPNLIRGHLPRKKFPGEKKKEKKPKKLWPHKLGLRPRNKTVDLESLMQYLILSENKKSLSISINNDCGIKMSYLEC